MEHFDLKEYLKDKKYNYEGLADRLGYYAGKIFEENQKYNLTGLKSVDDVVDTLIIGSLKPLDKFNVPRGTKYMDIGTGSGIPGMVIAITFPDFEGTLVDSNSKKTDFLSMIKSDLDVSNVTVRNMRAEDVGREPSFRDAFDIVFTRAFGPLYYSFEFALPVLKEKGYLYIYSALKPEELSSGLKDHIADLGGDLKAQSVHSDYSLSAEEGLLVVKARATSDKFPRRFPVVKRDAARIPETEV